MVTERDHSNIKKAREADIYRKILWSCIDLAITDATCAPLKETLKDAHSKNVLATLEFPRPMAKSITAMRFITSNVDVYLELLGVDGPVFHKRLLQLMYSDIPSVKGDKYNDNDKRAFRFNHGWWGRNKELIDIYQWGKIIELEEREA